MTLDELTAYLKGKGYTFDVEIEDIPPSDLWTEQEQIDDCCEPQSDFDECIEVGKTEPWSGWTDEQRNELGIEPPSPTPEELLDRAEDVYGKGNVHLQIVTTGPVGNCGEMETTWTGELGCCEDPPELLKVSGSSSVSIDNDYTYVVSGGESPASWAVQGTGLSVSGDGYTGRVHVDECFCTPGIVYATDSCLSVAPWVLSRSDGSWESIDDEVLSSPWGWLQDGSSSSFFLTGFSDDFTKVSTHYYSSGRFTGAPETVCPGAYDGIDTDTPIVTPSDPGLYTKCSETNVWWKLVEGHANTYDVIWSIGSGGTIEYTNSCQDSDLEEVAQDSPLTIADYSNGSVSWVGGEPPFTLSTSGVEFYLDSGRTTTQRTISGRSAVIYAGDACGYGYLTVSDRCGSSIEIGFKSASGEWEIWEDPYLTKGNGHLGLGNGEAATNSATYPGNIKYEGAEYKGTQPWRFAASNLLTSEASALTGLANYCSTAGYAPAVVPGSFTFNYDGNDYTCAECNTGRYGCGAASAIVPGGWWVYLVVTASAADLSIGTYAYTWRWVC